MTRFSANARKNTVSLKEVKNEARFINISLPRNLQSKKRLHENPTVQGFYDKSNLQE